MTRQDEIREGAILALMDHKGFDRAPTETIIGFVFSYLHEQGAVIKGQSIGASHPHLAAYWTWEPLIDEDKS